jgi:hypothetical protein
VDYKIELCKVTSRNNANDGAADDAAIKGQAQPGS